MTTQVPAALIENGAVLLGKMPDGLFTADAAGRAKFALGFVDHTLLAAGTLVQTVGTTTGAVATGTTTIPLDDTLPQQSTEGTEFLTRSITPLSASNVLQIDALLNLSNSTGAGTMIAALFRDSGADALAVAPMIMANSGVMTQVRISHRVTAGSTAATTFRVRAGFSTAATVTLNGTLGSRQFGGALISSLFVTEFKV
ncbi:MAG: hypothetical protein ING29_13040 [Azospirillum sp.]|nr:hypothetical protein [Azospirillum sp.]